MPAESGLKVFETRAELSIYIVHLYGTYSVAVGRTRIRALGVTDRSSLSYYVDAVFKINSFGIVLLASQSTTYSECSTVHVLISFVYAQFVYMLKG